MTVLDVFLNGRKLCRAGVGNDGVLSAIVSWVRFTGDAAREARRRRAPVEETRLQVGGLRGDTHRQWTERALTDGDEVTIAITRARSFDPPQSVKPRDRPRARQGASSELRPQFLNVDLDVWSTVPLDPLVAALGRGTYALHVGREGRHYSAHLELVPSPRDADRAIRRFAELIEQLPRSGRTLWKQARIREFNVGIQAGTRPHNYGLQLETETVRAAARVNARIGVTVYGAERGIT